MRKGRLAIRSILHNLPKFTSHQLPCIMPPLLPLIHSLILLLYFAHNTSSNPVNFVIPQCNENSISYITISRLFRWQNFNTETGEKYTDFDDYLSLFKSKRRMQIKRERRGVYEEEVRSVLSHL